MREYQLPDNCRGTILERIVQAKVLELQDLSLHSLEARLENAPAVRPFRKALESRSPAVIAEIKKASPSAGVIRPDFDPSGIARDYSEAGAAALSVITEVRHFQGALEILSGLRRESPLPLLRKDFIIDRRQVLEARHAGADAVLLIAALLDLQSLEGLRSEAERLGMEALVEVHNSQELDKAVAAGATLIGVNSRDLRTFEVSLDVALELAPEIPAGAFAVAESGIRTPDDIQRLSAAGYSGFLVGEHLMRAPSPGAALAALLGART